MLTFYVTSMTHTLQGKGWVYIEAERWFDAREVGCRLFGCPEVTALPSCRPTPEVHEGRFYTVAWKGMPPGSCKAMELEVLRWKEPLKKKGGSNGSAKSR